MAIKEGSPAPLFSLENHEGKKVDLKDFKGMNIILYFYPKDNTPGCTLEAQGFRDRWDDFQAAETVILGVSPDTCGSHAGFMEKFSLPFILLADPEKKVIEEYGAWGEKVMYGQKKMGVIRSTVWIGPDLKVKKHWRTVAKAEEHPAEVLNALREGVSGKGAPN